VAADAGVECEVRKRTKASRKTGNPLPILTTSLAIRNTPLNQVRRTAAPILLGAIEFIDAKVKLLGTHRFK
jgi:hypothetical protein